MNIEEGLRTPKSSRAPTSVSTSSSGPRSSSKREIKNTKITHFFTKLNSPLIRNSNSNHEQNENDQNQSDELSKDISTSTMKVSENVTTDAVKRIGTSDKEYVLIIPSSDDDTNTSSKGSTNCGRKIPSVQSSNIKSTGGPVLSYTNNEFGMAPRKRVRSPASVDKIEETSDPEQPRTPTRSSGIDSKSRDSMPEKRLKLESTPTRQSNNPSFGLKISRSTPTIVGSGTKTMDFQSDPIHPHLNYKFLYPPYRRDINKRTPDDPEYDEKTLDVPSEFLNSQTPALRQWWLIKQKNMDAILFFKMGKFYELFNEDAVIGVNNLDIMYMKGDETKPAHAGFPEISYDKYSKILIERGYKVLRIEQTETPAMMEERCSLTGKRGKFDKVVKREVCRVTTKGTQMLGIAETVFSSSQNQYLLAICEAESESKEEALVSKTYGVCFIDVTISQLYIGQFDDDHNQSKLNILLSHHKPTEVIFQRSNLSTTTYQALVRTGALLSSLRPNKEFWPVKKALCHLKVHGLFKNENGEFEWPPLLKKLFQDGEGSEDILALEPREEFSYGLNSFGAIVYYLQSQLIASQVLQCTSFDLYYTPFDYDAAKKLNLSDLTSTPTFPPMIMDHVALRNLEIFENSQGTSLATLYDSLNNCKTHFGQRLLKNWLCSPLRDVSQIENRLDAVQALKDNHNASLMNEISHTLNNTPDLERMLSKIKNQCFKSEGDSRAIMFDGDQYSKAKISAFLNLLQSFKRLRKFIVSVSSSAKKCDSKVLRRLLTFTTDDGLFPDYSSTIEYFDSAFDHEVARKTGKIIPAPGVDKSYDQCQENILAIKQQLDDYLEVQKEVLRCRSIEYFGTAKNRYQIQVPDAYCKNVTQEYRIETTRKGFKRYYTPRIDKMFQKLTTYEEEMKIILDGIMSKIFEQFTRKIKLWSAAINCIAILDVLQSIATFVRSLIANDIDVCRPEFMSSKNDPIIEYTNGRQPALIKINPDYIPNDLKLDRRLVLLSGANMGGKSTIMRQTALLVILAQIGSYVPASIMRLTPVDRIFSRLGASDRLLDGESTFYTELIETSAMLKYATKDSLLLLDELGRGTSTYDGTAIAYSVILEISSNIKCRCLFSTHYHTLVRDFENDPNVKLAHMACKVERNSDDETIDLDPLKENITFLYKIADGSVSRSYGFNVAKLAGIRSDIISQAFKKSKEIEFGSKALTALQNCRKEGLLSNGDDLKQMVLTKLANFK